LPVENQAMLAILDRVSKMNNVRRPLDEANGTSMLPRKVATFDRINNMVASMMLNMTSSMRFEGELNMDINEISMNLVPFPRINVLMPAISPLYVDKDCNVPVRKYVLIK
jgi:tubulin epsilon